MNRKLTLILLILIVLASACGVPAQPPIEESPSATATSWTLSATSTGTFTPTITASSTLMLTPTITLTPTETATPTITPTPTFAFPTVTVNAQAHCRYGPATAYLHAADLYRGDVGSVRGRYQNSKWLQVKFDKLDYFCWVAPSVVTVTGDISLIRNVSASNVSMPGPSALYGPPERVWATRQGDLVTIEWSSVWMTEDDDRGYFIEMYVCQNGGYIWFTVGEGTLMNQSITTYTVTDQAGCAYPSYGNLWAVEKHGYTTSTPIPWPAAIP